MYYEQAAMAIDIGDFNILDFIDQQRLAGNLIVYTEGYNEVDDNTGPSEMLDIVRQIRTDMQSMSTKIDPLRIGDRVEQRLPIRQHTVVRHRIGR